MRLKDDERGSVFWAVLAVLLVTSLLFSSVVFYGAWHQGQNRLLLYRTQAHYLALAALERARAYLEEKSATGTTAAGDSLSDSLAGNQSWTVSIAPWGCFWRATCNGRSHQARETLDALLGRTPSEAFSYALNLFGPPYPLVIAGETKVRGDVWLGPAGAMAGEFRGMRRQDSVLVKGRVVTAPPPPAPKFDWSVWNAFHDRVTALRSRVPVRTDKTFIIDDQLPQSPRDSVLVVDAPVVITAAGPQHTPPEFVIIATGPVTFGGNCDLDARWAIFSDHSIEVKDSARVAGVILCAPRIQIGDQARFSGQVIAESLLAVTGHAKTAFPTLLWVTSDGGPNVHPLLDLASDSLCEGIAGISPVKGPWDWSYATQGTGQLFLGPRSRWQGYLVVSGRAEVQGNVAGSIQSELLVLEDPPTTYLNWLVDARVDRLAWQGEAALPSFLRSTGTWTVAEFVMPRQTNRLKGLREIEVSGQ